MKENHYHHLLIMTALSFLTMFVLMYAMVNVSGNVYLNFNQLYMAAFMAAPMVLIEIVVMRAMYQNKKRNLLFISGSVAVMLLSFLFIRQQTAVSDSQFVRSMIPHHAGAILMCQQTSLEDSELKALCESIISGQQREIGQMKAVLARKK
jgi:uncharacterized protein (DUF305 family)